MRALLRQGMVALWIGACAPAALAQAPSDILTIDTEAVFANSLFGVALERQIKQAAEALVAENNRIEAELIAEEQALTEQRPELAPAEFRAKADAFDTRVQAIRAEQDAKARAVQMMDEEGRQRFIEELTPVLADIARQRNAVVVFERHEVFLSAESIDVTVEAISRVNERIGEDALDPLPETDAPADLPTPELPLLSPEPPRDE